MTRAEIRESVKRFCRGETAADNLTDWITQALKDQLDELVKRAEPNPTTPAGRPELVPLEIIQEMREKL